MYTEIAANKRKTWIIMLAFVALIGLLAFLVSKYILGEPSLTIGILVMAVVYAAISYFVGSRMAMALNAGKEITDTKDRLYRTVENLAITTGMPMPKVYVIEDPALNAFATGRDPQHAMVAATSGLVAAMTDAELEGVMAHEMAHIQNYDIRVSMIAFALVAVVAIMSDIVMRMFIFGSDDADDAGPIGIVIGIIVIVLAPIAAQMLKLAISRKREYLADATGALTTRYPEGLASALEKIQKQGSVMRRQNTATAHLFISNPLKTKGMNFNQLFSSHPPVEDRVNKLRGMGNKL